MPGPYAYDFMLCAPNDPRDIAMARRLAESILAYRLPRGLRRTAPSYHRVLEDFAGDDSEEANDRLDECRFLVLLCSPRTKYSGAALSRIARMARDGRRRAIIAVLMEGEPIDAFPETFIEKRTVQKLRADGTVEEIVETLEPVASDLRAPNQREFRRMLSYETVRITASLIGMHPDALERRHERRRIRRMATAIAIAASVCGVMAGTFIGFGVTAAREGRVAEQQTDAGAAMVNRLLTRLPEQFAGVPDALPYVSDSILDSLDGLYNHGSANIALIDIRYALAPSVNDDPALLIRKAAMWRRFGGVDAARSLYLTGIAATGFGEAARERFTATADALLLAEGCPGYAMYVFGGEGDAALSPGELIVGLNGAAFATYGAFFDALDAAVPGEAFRVTLLTRAEDGGFAEAERRLPYQALQALYTAGI